MTSPIIYWRLDNDVSEARFLTEIERLQGVERLRANQTGVGNREFKYKHILEVSLELKSYLWIGMAMLLNIGASVTNIFGPILINGLGYDKYRTTLLNMPFGALQFIIILSASFVAQKAKLKGLPLACYMVPVVVGLAMLFALPRGNSAQGALLAGYYLLSFIFGGNPLIASWIIGNTAGATKKSIVMALYNASSAAGNIVGPLLFSSTDAPKYIPGLRSCLACFSTLIAIVLIQWANLLVLNKLQARKRVQNGKQAKIVDHSMQNQYHEVDEDNTAEEGGAEHVGDNAFLDLTDRENDEFVYVY